MDLFSTFLVQYSNYAFEEKTDLVYYIFWRHLEEFGENTAAVLFTPVPNVISCLLCREKGEKRRKKKKEEEKKGKKETSRGIG